MRRRRSCSTSRGHGIFDLQAYDDYLNHRLPEVEFSESALAEGLSHLPQVAAAG